jgi:hypothetical protein
VARATSPAGGGGFGGGGGGGGNSSDGPDHHLTESLSGSFSKLPSESFPGSISESFGSDGGGKPMAAGQVHRKGRVGRPFRYIPPAGRRI